MPADPDGDAALVQRLARWADRWSPLVEVDGDGLTLDVSGVAHLFGGEAKLLRDVRKRFAALGLTVRVAIAPTAAAAWALARYSPSSVTPAKAGVHVSANRPPPELPNDMDASLRWHDELKLLPVSALRLDADTVRTLERLGLKTLGALMEMPRLALARRFRGAEDVVEALDRMTGRKPEPLTAAPVDPPPRALLKLEEPATHPEAAPSAGAADPALVRELEQRKLGARRLSLHRFSRRRQRRHRIGRHRDPEPRAQASPAAARRQGGGVEPGVRVRRLRADRRLDRELGGRAGKPGRGAVGRARSGAAGRPADGEARLEARAAAAA